jgi:hypothetical protein
MQEGRRAIGKERAGQLVDHQDQDVGFGHIVPRRAANLPMGGAGFALGQEEISNRYLPLSQSHRQTPFQDRDLPPSCRLIGKAWGGAYDYSH